MAVPLAHPRAGILVRARRRVVAALSTAAAVAALAVPGLSDESQAPVSDEVAELLARPDAEPRAWLEALSACLASPGADADEQALLSALAGVDRRRLRRLYELEPEAPLALRLAVLRVIGEVGGARDLDAAFAVVPARGASAPRDVLVALEEALLGVLRRDAEALALLRRMGWGDCTQAGEAAARALASAGSPAALDTLSSLLGFDPDLDLCLLREIGRAAIGEVAGEDTLASVRPYLWSADPMVRREATLAAGTLADAGSAARLVELLDDPARPVNEAAHWSLREISGLPFPPSARRWRAWHAGETLWFRSQAPALIESLGSPQEREVLRAVTLLSAHRLHRRLLVEAIEDVLAHDRPAVRRLACAALRQLGAMGDAGAVVERLEDEDAAVGNEAWMLLRELTRLDLPADAGAWRAALLPEAR